MESTALSTAIAIGGLVLMGLLGPLQFIAAIRPRTEWTIKNVYGGSPDATDPVAYFAANQGWAWADVLLWVPLQLTGSIGILLGERWGYLLALAASLTFVYTAIQFFIWDRDLDFRKPTINYWVFIWGMWPLFGIIQGVYVFGRLLS